MSEDMQEHYGDEPSLAWYGRPPYAEMSQDELAAAADTTASSRADIYGRVAMSALVVGGALLLARSAAFRAVTWRLAKFAVTTWLPARLAAEVRRAWHDASLVGGSDAEASRPR